MPTDNFPMLARYNAWANRRIYDAAATLPDSEYRKTRACAFFDSIHGTLNHLLVVDRLWIPRIEDKPHDIESLGQILHEEFAALRAAREAEDERLIGFVDGLDEDALARAVSYSLMSGPGECSTPVHIILITLFNHQTHHRGQVHAMLKEAGVPPPPLDIIDFLD